MSWNVGAERIFGYTSEEAKGQPITIIIPDERLDEEDYILGQIKRGERVDHFETIRRRKDGNLQDISLTISPIKDQAGQIIGASKIARDITEQKRAEKRLKELNETLEERVEERTASLLSYQKQLRSLAMQLSRAEEQERQQLASDLHDNLGQLLAIGKMKISMLKTEDESEVSEVLELVDDAITYTRELMSDLKPPPSLDDEDLKSAIDWVANKMKKHDLEVEVKKADDQPKPLNEEVRSTLLRSTRELLFNVVKHAGVSQAKVTILRDADQIKVIVEDEGPGFNVDERRKESGGFGLFSIIERMNFLNGNMEIESEPDKGTRVSLTVPVSEGEESAAAKNSVSKSTSSEKTSTNKKIKILIADDHQIVREGLRKRMEEENDLSVVAEASDGNEVLKLVKEASPDVIVMDVTMPDMDGIEATQKIKKALPDIDIIGLSSYDDEEFEREMLKAGAAAYLTKSEAFETLSATIRSATAEEKEL